MERGSGKKVRKGVRLVDVERGGIRGLYSAGIEYNGVHVGYVQRVRGQEGYHAYAQDGKRVSSGRNLNEVKDDLREAGAAGELTKTDDELSPT